MLICKKNAAIKIMCKIIIHLVWVICFIITSPCSGSDSKFELSPEEKAWISEHHVVHARVGAVPPLHFFEGSPKGISVEYLNLIADRTGFQVKYITDIPWSKALDYIKNHEKIDLILTAKITEERKKFISFTDNYLNIPWVIFIRDEIGFISDIVDLKHKTVSVERGYVMHSQLIEQFPDIKLLVVETSREAVEAVATGKADAYIGNLTIATYIIQQNNFNNIKIAAPTPFDNHNQAMGIRDDWSPLTSIINKTLKSLTPEEHEDIRHRWMAVRYEYGISKLDVIKWILVISIFSILIIGIIMFWNRRLQKEITQRKQVEEKLKKSEELLNQTGDMAKVGGWQLDLETQRVIWTQTTGRIHELPDGFVPALDEAINFYHPDDREAVTEFVNQAIEAGKSYDFEARLITANGKQRWVRAIGQPIMKANKCVRLSGAFHDITERKKMETRLQQSQKMESIGTLAGGIAHDFNNILYPIIGFTELSMQDLPKTHEIQENLQDILSGAKRARDLVKQILMFARQEKQTLKPIVLKPVLEEAMKLLRSTIPANIDIQSHLYDGEDYVLCDATEIHEIVMNLCTNAYHSMEEDGGTIIVKLNKQDPSPDLKLPLGEYICLSVSDSGVGIPKDIIDKIFEPYLTTKEVGKGSGLGLSVVHGIVTNYKGDISVESNPGKGSVFNVFLPVTSQSEKVEQKRIKDKSLDGTEHILFVDDEASIVKLAKRILERLGYTITGKTSCTEALELFKEKPDEFDLVITDMAMPIMTGAEFAKKILKIQPDIPIIMCSGFSEKVDSGIAKSIGIKEYIKKPILTDELTSKIREVLNQSSKG